MPKQSSEQLSKLWRAGATMSQAWLIYAEPKLKARWQNLQKQSATNALTESAEIASKSDKAPLEKLLQVFEAPHTIIAERTELQTQLKQNILSYLGSGHLHGYGYEMPRSLNQSPVEIPKVVWAGKCDWQGAGLNWKGLQLADIRLITKNKRNEILERGIANISPVQKAGRPTVGPAFEAAFIALNESGEIDVNASQNSHFPKIRKWLDLNYPNLSVSAANISEPTFRRHFGPLFKDLKKRSKL